MNTNKITVNKNQQSIENLSESLDEISLPDKEFGKIKSRASTKALRDIFLEATGGIGKAIKTALGYNETVNEQIRQRKKEILLSLYFKQTGENEEEINKIERFLTDPQGNVLFNKILAILNDGTPNRYYIRMLTNALNYVVLSKFDMLFEKHKYALDRIGRLTPQALVVLSDKPNWPKYQIGNYASSSGVITSEWIIHFTPIYAPLRGIKDTEKQRKVAHVLRELLADDLIRSRLPGQKDSRDHGSLKEAENTAIVEPTELGEEILSYINLE